MGCVGSGQERSVTKIERAQNKIQIQLNESQLYILKLIYEDLSLRVIDQALNLENFLLFFEKNGLWGERLFKQFDHDKSLLISFTQFTRGISKLFKTSENQKIQLLFSFFSDKNEASKQGINFKEFLTMLYNYPKQSLKKILNDADFFNTQLKTHLVTDKNRKLQSLMKNGGATGQNFRIDGQNSELGSMVGKNILAELGSNKNAEMMIKLSIPGKKDIEVKTANIHNLVKKFARNVFKNNNIDIESGRLSAEEFKKWIKGHKTLFDNYYQGFHNEVWQFNPQTLKPRFMSQPFEKKQEAKFLMNGKLIKVVIILLKSIIVVCEEDNESKPIKVICLEGLAVKKNLDQENGFSIEISHRDGIYPVKNIFFKNQQISTQWLNALKCFKGQSVQQLYQILEQIGTGKFSIVYEAKERATGKTFAIKVIQSYKLQSDSKLLIAHESRIMSLLSNSFLVFYKETIQSKTHIYIITELVRGKDLFEFVRQNLYLSQPETALIAYQLMMGVRYLHSLGIVHRDLKPQNVMISLNQNDEIGTIKLIDFGFANYLSSLKQLPSSDILAGTPNYIAPQMLKCEPISEKIDNFAIGSIVFFALSGTPPFNAYNISQIFQKTIDSQYDYRDKRWNIISPEAKMFIDSLLQNDPAKRMTLDEGIKHPWITKNCKKMQEDPPQVRKTAKNTTKVAEVF